MRESCQVSSGLEDKQQRTHALKMTGPAATLHSLQHAFRFYQ